MKQILILLGMLVFIAVAAAQSMGPNEDTITKPPAREFDVGHCYEYEVRMLIAATNPQDPNQDAYLKAANAYSQLDTIGQLC